ncbi:MAG: hypothetical protein RLZZ618_1217 [Pseudomonadota bacterium]|jgi:hypothetical protein
MQPLPDAEPLAPDEAPDAMSPFWARALRVLWPAFLMSGVLEALLFVVVDPMSLRWFGREPLDWSATAVYSVTFLIIWAVMATSGALTQLLDEPGSGLGRR